MEISTLLAVFGAVVGGLASMYSEYKKNKRASEEVREAERIAFIEQPDLLESRLREITQSQEGLEERTNQIQKLLQDSREATSVGRLFNLYSKQIEKYQQETRSRASWSFIFAIIAMFAGFGFVIWGGSVLLTAKETIVLVAGGLLATVGGAISGFISKTFLDVHKLSLTQLNTYFQQPVINDHILMAQRLADDVDDLETRKKAYETIIVSISGLIDVKSGQGNKNG